MNWQFTVYSISLSIVGVISGYLAVWTWRRNPVTGTTPFAFMMLAVSEWSFGYALETAAVNLSSKLVFAKFEYLGITMLPVMWFWFVIQYVNREKWLTRRNLLLMFICPVITILLTWTNNIHGLIWKNVQTDSINHLVMLVTHGAWFWIHVTYSYLLLLSGTLLLFHALFRSPRLYRGQISALLFCILIPWLGNFLYLSGLNPFTHLNLTPFGFIITGLAMALGLFRYRMFDLVPVASNVIIENMNDCVIVLNCQGRIVNYNPAAEAQFSFLRNGAIGQPIIQVLSNWSTLAESCKRDGWVRTELKLAVNDTTRIYDLIISSLHDSRGHSKGHIMVWRDITEIKQAEIKKLIDRKRDQSMAESVKDAIISADSLGRIVSWNNGAKNIFLYEEKEILGERVDLLMPEKYKQEHWNGMERIRSGGKTRVIGETVELEGKRKNGDIFPMELSLAFWKTGNDLFFTAIIRDISRRKQAEDKLKETIERFKSLTNRLNIGYYRNTPGPGGKFVEANRSILRMFGYDSMEEFLKIPVSDLYQLPDERKEISNEIMEAGIIKNKIVRLKRKDGTPLIGSVSARSVRNNNGEITFFDGIVKDVTERVDAENKIKKLQKQILHSQKMEAIGTLAGGIAHDFNNILSAVIGYTELALFDAVEGSHLHHSLTLSLQAANRASDLVKQILTFSRQTESKIKPIYLNPLIKEALKMLRSTIPSSIELKKDISKKLLTIKADPIQIHQVVINLVTNASHAVNGNNGIISIKLKEFFLDKDETNSHKKIIPGHYARLTISDNGTGISKENIDHIFDPYFTTKEKQKGTGLGLSVVYGIVETCNGYITVDSDVNKGTVFNIHFPIVNEKVIEVGADWKNTLTTGHEHILFVDDELDIVDIQKRFLHQLGYTVTSRTCSTEALEVFRSMPDKFDLVISDMTMPNMTGDKLAHEIKIIRPDIPIILCTGFSEKVDKMHPCQKEFDKIIMKPVDIAKMSQAIREVIKIKK